MSGRGFTLGGAQGSRCVPTCWGEWSPVRPGFSTGIASASLAERRLRTGTVGSGRLVLPTRLLLALRPYGSLPIWVTADGSGARDSTVDLLLGTNEDSQIASLNFSGDGCSGNDPTNSLGATYESDWDARIYSRAQTDIYPAGIWYVICPVD